MTCPFFGQTFLALTVALVPAANRAQVAAAEKPVGRPVRHVDVEKGSATVLWASLGGVDDVRDAEVPGPNALELELRGHLRAVWSEPRSEWFGLLAEGNAADYLALGEEGATTEFATSPWLTRREGTPALIDYSPSGGALSILIGDPISALELLQVSRGEGSESHGDWDLGQTMVWRPFGELIVAAALVGSADRVQVAVITTIDAVTTSTDDDSPGRFQLVQLHVGQLEHSTLRWTHAIPLELGDRDEDALFQMGARELAPMAMVDLGEVQYIALGLPNWGPRTGALLVWRMDDWKRPDSRRLISWNGTADLDRGRETRLGCAVVLSSDGEQAPPTVYTAAPEAGLEAAALAFRCDTGERVGLHHPLVDRWSQGSQWRRLSPSSVVDGISAACVYVIPRGESGLTLNPGRTGAILRFGAGVGGRSILDEVR